jgi:hypothetical protein
MEIVGLRGALAVQLRKLDAAVSRLGGGGLSFGFPFAKVDRERREVVGVATAEVVDSQNEVLEYAGSRRAFSEWRDLNVREMHEPVAAGTVLEVVPDDARRQIVVRARVSRGAESTWVKCLDGTLKGFSVGGVRLESRVRDDGVRVTSRYRISELSLVDSPACPVSSISVLKAVGLTEGAVAVDRCAALAARLDIVARSLAAGVRPLPAEVQACFGVAAALAKSDRVPRCDSVAVRDWARLGPGIAERLSVLSRGLRMTADAAYLGKIAAASVTLLEELTTAADRARPMSRVAPSLAEVAGAMAKLDGAGVWVGAVRDGLEAGVFKLGTMGKVVAAAGPTLLELVEMEERLAAELRRAHETGLQQNSREYRELSETYFKVVQRRKAAQRGA